MALPNPDLYNPPPSTGTRTSGGGSLGGILRGFNFGRGNSRFLSGFDLPPELLPQNRAQPPGQLTLPPDWRNPGSGEDLHPPPPGQGPGTENPDVYNGLGQFLPYVGIEGVQDYRLPSSMFSGAQNADQMYTQFLSRGGASRERAAQMAATSRAINSRGNRMGLMGARGGAKTRPAASSAASEAVAMRRKRKMLPGQEQP